MVVTLFRGILIVAVAKYNLIRPGGSIVLTSGTAGISPHSNASLGGALNGAVIALTRGLAVDLAKKQVRVNTVIPGLVQTELWEKVIPDKGRREATIEGAKSKLLVPFVGTPRDIAEAYVYFLRADYATGTTVVIDGGALLT
jgi:NAD(P)-dependent dehydrogenase (short-subunit alcohol dehydrogenase family)